MSSGSKIITAATLASETSTATWAVLMVVVSVLIAMTLAFFRSKNAELSEARKTASKNADEATSARHNEIKTLIGGVKESVDGVAHRMDKVEDRVGHLEQGHERLEIQIKSIKEGGER
ncbi:hypothetical protein [Synechococcus sp. N5]|uniref:hypothetical protein n=1 Tax=Synechococcus sp. N5 TaxID=2575515 RepID=UPI000E0F14E0|nr:hypothetical protein [Synechococcus sp. N5]